LLSDVPQHCKKRQTKHVNVLKKAANTRNIVIPSPISSMARSTMVLIITAIALIVIVSAQKKDETVSNPSLTITIQEYTYATGT
jgi:hypothetical protein